MSSTYCDRFGSADPILWLVGLEIRTRVTVESRLINHGCSPLIHRPLLAARPDDCPLHHCSAGYAIAYACLTVSPS